MLIKNCLALKQIYFIFRSHVFQKLLNIQRENDIFEIFNYPKISDFTHQSSLKWFLFMSLWYSGRNQRSPYFQKRRSRERKCREVYGEELRSVGLL